MLICHLRLCEGWYVSLVNSVVYAIEMLYFPENTRIFRPTTASQDDSMQEYIILSRRVEDSGIVPSLPLLQTL